jgi:hypothetical protein
MATRLHFIFDGGPDEETHTLREVADGQNKPLTFGHLARWVPVSENNNVWAMQVDTIPLDRRPVVALCVLYDTKATSEVAQDLADNGSIVLQPSRSLYSIAQESSDIVAHEKRLQDDRIEMADRLFIVNDKIDVEEQVRTFIRKAVDEQIAYAGQLKRRVQYLRYDT